MEVCESIAENRALLTTFELERVNIILSGKEQNPWRDSPVTLMLPGGKTETLLLLSDPKNTAEGEFRFFRLEASASQGCPAMGSVLYQIK